MEAIAGKVHGLRRTCLVEAGENFFDSFQQVRPNSTAVVSLIKPSEAAMLETPDHQSTA
jgi:hypothetical protein